MIEDGIDYFVVERERVCSPEIVETFRHQLLIVSVNFFQFPRVVIFSLCTESFVPVHALIFPHSAELLAQQS